MLHTSAVLLESSVHGKERRAQRGISKRDLQAAVKYGKKEPGHRCPRTGRPRWMYTFADIVYITDETSTIEVTSYMPELPLPKVTIPHAYLTKNEEAKRRIARNRDVITSHTVLVVDMSKSMSKADMDGHRSRSRGVYYNLAEMYIAEALPPIESGLFSGNGKSFTDVVTLIEMRDGATVVFECQPVSWVLFNEFVELAEMKDSRGNGNYVQSVEESFRILANYSHSNCASTLFFFSDGRPSDGCTRYKYSSESFPECLYDLIKSQCRLFGDKLTFSAFGFSHNVDDFAIMREMISAARAAGVKASFHQGYRTDDGLAVAISNTLSSTIDTRSLLSRLDIGGGIADRAKTDSVKASIQNAPDQFAFNNTMWKFFNSYKLVPKTAVRRVELRWVENASTGSYASDWVEVSLQASTAMGIAVSKAHFGEGAERVVYLMTEINAANEAVGAPLVAKVSLYKHKEKDLLHLRRWHKTFVKTQMVASNLAGKFNERLDRLGVSKFVPRVMFLPCSIYEGHEVSLGRRTEFAFLAESRLDPSQYLKWNNNSGGTDGVVRHNAINYEPLAIGDAKKAHVGTIAEEDEDEVEEEEDCGVQPATEPSRRVEPSARVRELEKCVLEIDVPQAFSHFTYRHTWRNKLVCDLQGVLTVEGGFRSSSGPIPAFTHPTGRMAARITDTKGSLPSSRLINATRCVMCLALPILP